MVYKIKKFNKKQKIYNLFIIIFKLNLLLEFNVFLFLLFFSRNFFVKFNLITIIIIRQKKCTKPKITQTRKIFMVFSQWCTFSIFFVSLYFQIILVFYFLNSTYFGIQNHSTNWFTGIAALLVSYNIIWLAKSVEKLNYFLAEKNNNQLP